MKNQPFSFTNRVGYVNKYTRIQNLIQKTRALIEVQKLLNCSFFYWRAQQAVNC